MLIIMMGPPGAGKGTQSKRLHQYLQVPHLSTGDILRDAIESGSDLGRKVAAIINRGQLAPDETVSHVVFDRLAEPDCRDGCILDGYPRNLHQAHDLTEHLMALGRDVDAVLNLRVADEVLVGRMLKRAEIEHRADDCPQTIARRLQVYHSQTEPLLDYYARRGVLRVVDGDGDEDEVFDRVLACVQQWNGRHPRAQVDHESTAR